MLSFHNSGASSLRNFCVLCVSALSFVIALHSAPANHAGPKPARTDRLGAASNASQSQEEVDGKLSGCVSCHTSTDEPTMHPTKTVHLGCTGCHAAEVRAVSTSMMTHSGFLWGAALYNNGGYPSKNVRFGESYNRDGLPQSIKTFPKPTAEETRAKGVIPELDPLYRWEISQPGKVLRSFE